MTTTMRRPSLSAERRPLWRAAAMIADRLSRRRNRSSLPQPPADAWERLLTTDGYLKLALEKGWQHAAVEAKCDVDAAYYGLVRKLEEYSRDVDALAGEQCRQTEADIFRDLVALEEEFDEMEIELDESAISVTTGNIVLEGLDLGRFQIVLSWNLIGEPHPYLVKALDPNPAGSDSTVTHPHVRDEALCEGDGQQAVSNALREGRLLDFFILVRQILETYNEDGPFVRLSRWDGVACRDCGYSESDDDASSCEACEADICGDCGSSCRTCSRTICSGCQTCCAGCDETCCERCLKICAGCDEQFCELCLEIDVCEACRAENEENNENEENPNHDDPDKRAGDDRGATGIGKTGVDAGGIENDGNDLRGDGEVGTAGDAPEKLDAHPLDRIAAAFPEDEDVAASLQPLCLG